jgi:excisionase family DNA binding protein
LEHYRKVNRNWRKRERKDENVELEKDYLLRMNDYPNSKSHWTQVDNEYLRNTYGLLPDEEIEQTLGRTWGGIEKQARILGLDKLAHYRTPTKLATVLGIDPKTVRAWITKGKLKAVKTHVRHAWHIPDEAVTEFLRKEPYYAMVAQREHEKARLAQQYHEWEAA